MEDSNFGEEGGEEKCERGGGRGRASRMRAGVGVGSLACEVCRDSRRDAKRRDDTPSQNPFHTPLRPHALRFTPPASWLFCAAPSSPPPMPSTAAPVQPPRGGWPGERRGGAR
eukprot:scaffold12661_cov62-Isochrysis_galbana.AAC.1